ncbi:MAG: PIN domain-containing protein [Selenomonadaceae bacterium]|nr:PIN domain-containing protein [Selenomonadaceae bacterium]
MRLMLDTNILMDYMTEREPFFPAVRKIILGCKNGEFDGIVSAHSLVDMFYILRKHFSNSERRKMLLAFGEFVQTESIDAEKLCAALQNDPFIDFEDCLVVECAKSAHVDFIITRNLKDYALSEVPVLSPEQLLEMINHSASQSP